MPHSRFVRPVIYAVAALISCLLAATMLYNSWSLYTIHHQDAGDSLVQAAHQDAQLIAERLKTYQNILEHWAQQTSLHQLLKHPAPHTALQWIASHRASLPHVLALNIQNAQGQWLDTVPATLLPQCQAQMERLSDIDYLNKHPMPARLHSSPNGQEKHFDLYTLIQDKEQVLGVLYLTISLKLLEDTFKQLYLPTQSSLQVRVMDGREQLIYAARSHTKNNAQQQWQLTRRIRVYPSHWQLEIRQIHETDHSQLIIVLISLGAGFLLTIGVVAVTQRLLMRDYLSDFEALKELVSHIAESRPVQDFALAPRLQETAKMLAAIRPTAEKIQQAHQELEHLSRTDELTQLANRRAYQNALQQAMTEARDGMSIALILLDLDGFKLLNDTAGHPVGDEILKLLARILLKHHNPQTEFCARLGGDEFACILFNTQHTRITQWLERVRNDFMQGQQQQFAQYPQCTLSFGFTFIDGENPEENDDRAFRRADHALYDAKKAGKNTFRQG